MKIISWNVNGVRAITKKDFFSDVLKMDPDVLCLQETKAQGTEVEEALSGLPEYYLYHNSGKRKGYSGVAILAKSKPITVTNNIGILEHDGEGRVQCAEFEGF